MQRSKQFQRSHLVIGEFGRRGFCEGFCRGDIFWFLVYANVANWKFVWFFFCRCTLEIKVEKMCFFLPGELEYAHLLCGYSTYPTNQALLTIGFP